MATANDATKQIANVFILLNYNINSQAPCDTFYTHFSATHTFDKNVRNPWWKIAKTKKTKLSPIPLNMLSVDSEILNFCLFYQSFVKIRGLAVFRWYSCNGLVHDSLISRLQHSLKNATRTQNAGTFLSVNKRVHRAIDTV